MGGEWRQIRIGELGRVVTGRTPPGNDERYYGEAVPFLTPSDMDDRRSVERPTRHLSAFGAAELNRCLVPQGVGVSCIGWQMGKAVLIERPTITNQQINSIIVDPAVADRMFVYYSLCSRRSEFFKLGAGGSRTPILNKGDFEGLPFVLPPVVEQRAIARILGALDDKIDLNRKSNATLEAMARALFKSWFVDFDPVRAKAAGRAPSGVDAETAKLFPSEFVESELGPIPKGWTAVPVYDIATYVNGAAYKAFQPNDERRGLPIIKIAELKAGVTAQTKFSEVAMPEKYRLRTGDILFSWSGNPDTSIDTFVWAHGEAWLNQHIFRVDLRSPSDRSFVLATLKYLRPVFAEIARNKQTTGLGHVTAGDMQRLLVVKPDWQVLRAWERVASPVFAAAFHNELESTSLARIRDELLPRLLSGELPVDAAKRAVEEVA